MLKVIIAQGGKDGHTVHTAVPEAVIRAGHGVSRLEDYAARTDLGKSEPDAQITSR